MKSKSLMVAAKSKVTEDKLVDELSDVEVRRQ